MNRKLSTWGAYTLIIAILIIVFFPIFWLVLLSLKTQVQAMAYPPLFIFEPAWENYVTLFTDNSNFGMSLINSIIIAVGSVGSSLIIGVPTSYALLRSKFRFKKALLSWNLITRMVPGMVFIIPYFTVYQLIGLRDSYIGLIIIYGIYNLPLVIWIMVPFFDQIPRDLEEAARVDGASLIKTFFMIILPISTPGLITATIFTFIFSWNEFVFAVILTRRHAITAPVAITKYIAYEGLEWGTMAAGGVCMLIPVIVISGLIRKYMVKGLMSGAVKG
jgi:multiple sugar transport system permease protein